MVQLWGFRQKTTWATVKLDIMLLELVVFMLKGDFLFQCHNPVKTALPSYVCLRCSGFLFLKTSIATIIMLILWSSNLGFVVPVFNYIIIKKVGHYK